MGGLTILTERRGQICSGETRKGEIQCERQSLAGAVSQRACVFCGSRVVLYPIADAVHLVHGPAGCAAYTWDIRGSLSSGPELHRSSFSTDLREQDVIHGGEPRLYRALVELIREHRPAAAFVYSTCIVGIIGDDVEAVCRQVAEEQGLPVIAVKSEGFRGTKKDGYAAACDAISTLIGRREVLGDNARTLNVLGEFNLAGESWIIRRYFEEMGLRVQAVMTGDGRVGDIEGAHCARLNVLQCSGSMAPLARQMRERWGIPFIRVSFFGLEDVATSLRSAAGVFADPEVTARTEALIRRESARVEPALDRYKALLTGKRAAIYVGGAFKAISLVKALRRIGIETVVAGSQTGSREEYVELRQACGAQTVLIDDANPLELAKFAVECGADLLVGGVKERPLAYKLGIAFCDHNHERKKPLAGFEGMLNFAKEVHASIASPVWQFLRRPTEPRGTDGD